MFLFFCNNDSKIKDVFIVTVQKMSDFNVLVSFFSHTGRDIMTTEMQEIAITEDKPLLTGQADTKVSAPRVHTHTHTHTNT